MYNKNIFRKTNDKKLLHKVGKQWVTVSIAMLMLIGGGAIVSHTTHAATDAPKTTSVANQPTQKANNQSKQVSNSAIQSSASNLHQTLLNNSVKLNAKPSNNAPIHQTAKPNSAYANYLKQMGGQRAYNNLMNNEAKSANNNNKITKPTNNKQLGSDNDSQRGVILPTYCGLHYKYNNSDQSVEFTNGTLDKSDLSNFLQSADFGATEDYGGIDVPIKSVKFDNNINISKAKNMSNMFYLCHDLQSVNFGNNFDTSNVTNMAGMFAGDTSLQSVNFGNKFNTSKVTNMDGLLSPTIQQININPSITKLNKNALSSASLYMSKGKPGSIYKFSDANNFSEPGTYVTASKLPSNSILEKKYHGLNYIYNSANQSIEFISGSITPSDSSDSIPNFLLSNDFDYDDSNPYYPISPIKHIKFDNGVYTNQVKSMENMLSGCYNLQSINFGSNFNTNNIDTSDIFTDCSNLQSIIINSSNTTFKGNTGLSNKFYSKNGSTYQVHNFNNGNKGTFTTIYNLPSNSVITGQYDGLNYTYNLNNQSVEFTGGQFTNSDANDFLGNSDLGAKRISSKGSTYYYVSPIKSVEFASDINTTKLTNINNMFDNAPYLQHVTFGKSFNTQNIQSMSNMFNTKGASDDGSDNVSDSQLKSITIRSSDTKFNNSASLPSMYISNGTNNQYNINDFSKGNKGISYTFTNIPSGTIQGKYKGLNYIYHASNKTLEFTSGKINVSNTSDFLNQPQFGGNNSNPYSSYNMTLQHVQFDKGVDTSNVTNMSNMFAKDDSLESLNFQSDSFDTSNVTNMSDMFLDDAELQSLSLPNSFNTNNVNNMNGMFFGDISLNTLKLPETFVTNRNNESENVSTNAMFAGDAELNQLTLPDNLYLNSDMIKLANDTNPGSDGLIWTQVNMIHGTKDAMAIRTKLANELANSNTISSMLGEGYNTQAPYVNIDPYASYQRLIDPYDSPYVVDPLGWSYANDSNIKNFALQTINTNGNISSDMKQYFSDKYLSPFPVSNISFYKQNSDKNSDGYTTNSYPTNILQLFNGGAHPGTWVREPNTESDAQISSLANARTSLSNKVASDERAIASDNKEITSADGTISSDNTKLANDERSLKSDATSLANTKASLSANNSWISSNSASLSNASKEAHSASTSANVNSQNISNNSASASASASDAQSNAENYASNSITPISTDINTLSGSANNDYDNAVNGINNATTDLTNNTASLSSSANNDYTTAITNMNSKATSLSNSANSGIQSNSISISKLSASASSELIDASKTINQNTKDVKVLSNKTNQGLKNVQGQITTNKTNADKALNNLQKTLKHPTTHTNNAQLNKDINVINQALGNKEDKTDFGKTVSDIHNLINTKADNAKIMNDEKQLQNAINAKPNNAGTTTTVHTVETTGTNDTEVKADKNALQNEISTKADRAKVQIELRKLQKDLKNRPTYHKHFAGKSFYILVKKPILIHKTAKAIGSNKDFVGIIKPSQHTLVHVLGKKDGHYVIKYLGHYYFITANHKYVKNAYYQKNDLKKTNYIKVIKPAGEYSKINYTKYNQNSRITTWNVGTVIPVRNVQILGNSDVTRFHLVNGHYITANKLFVKLI